MSLKLKLENLNEIEKLEGKQEDNATYEQNSLRYDSDGLILITERNGIQLITQKVAEIISLTHKKHNNVL